MWAPSARRARHYAALMDALRNRLTAALAAAAIALTVAACGDDDVDQIRDEAESAADEIRTEAESATDDLRKEGEDLKKELDESDSPDELREQIEEFEDRARGSSEDVQKEAEELRKELEEQLPSGGRVRGLDRVVRDHAVQAHACSHPDRRQRRDCARERTRQQRAQRDDGHNRQ